MASALTAIMMTGIATSISSIARIWIRPLTGWGSTLVAIYPLNAAVR